MNDVIIIGGGPAGSTAAAFLAMKGRQVLLLEKEKFPRDHVGESLLPFCYKLFDQLGLLDQMKASFVRKPGVRFIDKEGVASTTWCFNHVIHDPSYLSFQVLRSEFDQMLLNNARRFGAVAIEETRVDAVNLERPDGLVEVRAVGPDGKRQSHLARFVLDGSGRNAFLASSRGIRKKFAELDRTALWSHYSGAELIGGLEEGLSLIIYLGGEKKGWLWIFPLGLDRLTVGVVLNNEYIRSQRAKFEAEGVEDWKQALYEQELSYSPFAGRLLAEARMIQPLVIEGDYSYYSETKYGENFAIVGDAATFIDPIFSSGIYLAMNGAWLVSEGIHQKLDLERGALEPLEAAYRKIEGAYKMVFKLIQFFYTPNVINFAQMESASELVYQEHQNAMAVGHYLLAGDFFDRYDDYGKVIDLLRQPRVYELYKQLVLTRPTLQATSCHANMADMFPK
ncbi:MAG: tryptophan 7-halogenase [Chloroflexi bacterium]|nr:tryptophan 7-halogenase [Chloroflexota bacterium]MCI0574998.1 tryptophan 7-halogenase [Chloroflexota bacterium]MCI0645774.1 tryptophan 7-halogenase [Chloroflexota bacterium]MCI0727701.1 tryptophan 7-halogenase [Chloroflexota bacterium]